MGDQTLAPKGNGTCSHFAVNLQGNMQLMDALLKNGKVNKGASLMYSGSEAARGVSSFGFACPVYASGSKEEFVDLINGKAFANASWDVNKGYP